MALFLDASLIFVTKFMDGDWEPGQLLSCMTGVVMTSCHRKNREAIKESLPMVEKMCQLVLLLGAPMEHVCVSFCA